MREPILKAVANPPKILWGPVLPVMVNLAMQFPFMFMLIGSFNLNPLVFIFSILIIHIIIVSYGVKEPHLSAMIQAFGQSHITVTNLYKVKGSKFEP